MENGIYRSWKLIEKGKIGKGKFEHFVPSTLDLAQGFMIC